MDPQIKELLQILLQGKFETDKSVKNLAVAVTKSVDAADARVRRSE